MKRIANIEVLVPKVAQGTAQEAVSSGISGVFTTTAHFLCGENPWGFHQDHHFSGPLSEVRRGARIESAALSAMREGLSYIELSPEDHSVLLKVLASQSPSAKNKMHPALARCILPIVDAITYPEVQDKKA